MPDQDATHSPDVPPVPDAQPGAEVVSARYADIVTALPDRLALVDRGCRLLLANVAFLQFIGCRRDEAIGRPFMSLHGESTLKTLLYRHLNTCLDQARTIVEDWRQTTASGEHHYQVRLLPCRDAQGLVTGIIIEVRDMTDVRDAERRLLQAAAVYAATAEGILITDPEGTVVAINAAFTQITGYAESEILGRKPSLLNAQWHSRGFFIGLWRRLLRQGAWQGEIWNRRKNGEIYRQRLTIRRVLDHDGRPVNFVGLFAERSVSPGAPRLTEHLIHYDALTKLPNHLLFESRLDHAIELGRRKEAILAIFILDLDHFAHINSSLGYQIGDELLRTIGLKLRETIRPSDTLARLRADQFALLFEEIEDSDEVTEIANRLKALMSRPIRIRGHQLHVTLSVGIAVSTELRENRRALMANAESALKLVKRQGGNGFQILASAPEQIAREHQQRLARLRAALSASELQLLYRPGMDMSRDGFDSVSVSIQWKSPELGLINQERLLALAEESGLILELGDWLLTGACRQAQDWVESGLGIKRLVIEINEAQLRRGDLARTLAQCLEDYPAVATRLELEFSEQLLLKHREQIAEVFQGLNELGIGLCLSDVGIGWTAPALLQRLPIRALKIHSSFIAALPDAHHELAVVEALIAMAQALGLEIRADGVRTKEQQYQLLSLGCLKAQGDLFGEPLSAAQFEFRLNPPPAQKPPVPLGN